MCVGKLEACPMRAIITVIAASRVATWQCEQILKTYKVLFFSLVALSDASLSVLRSFHTESERASDAAMRLTEKLEHYIF